MVYLWWFSFEWDHGGKEVWFTFWLFRFVWDHGGEDVYLCIFRPNSHNTTLHMDKNSEGKLVL